MSWCQRKDVGGYQAELGMAVDSIRTLCASQSMYPVGQAHQLELVHYETLDDFRFERCVWEYGSHLCHEEDIMDQELAGSLCTVASIQNLLSKIDSLSNTKHNTIRLRQNIHYTIYINL
jgi:hypothetical protein